MIKIEKLSYRYRSKGAVLLNDLSLQFNGGGIYGLLGKNGVGKTTLLYLMSGLLTPHAGVVQINGRDVRKRDVAVLQDLFLVPEEFELPSMSLTRYVSLNAPFYPNFNHKELEENLAFFGLDPSIKDMEELSMGQKKKVFMSFAMATNTRYLLMDEPTNGLDIPSKSQFRKFIVSHMTDERIFVLSTHQLRDVEQVLDHVVMIDNRRLLLNASLAALSSRYRFVETDDEDLIAQAIYQSDSIGGKTILLPNDTDDETDVNIEFLFSALLANPDLFANETFINKILEEEKQ